MFYWNIDTPIYWHIVYGWFFAGTVEWLWHKQYILQSITYLLSNLLIENFCQLLLNSSPLFPTLFSASVDLPTDCNLSSLAPSFSLCLFKPLAATSSRSEGWRRNSWFFFCGLRFGVILFFYLRSHFSVQLFSMWTENKEHREEE